MKKYEPIISSISDPEVYSWVCGGGNRAAKAKVWRKRAWSACDTTTRESGKVITVGGLKTFRDCQKLCDRLNAKNKKGKTMLRFERSESPSWAQYVDYASNKQPDGSYFVICCSDYGRRMWLQRVYLAEIDRKTLNKLERWSGMHQLESEHEIARNLAAWFSYGIRDNRQGRSPKPLAYIKLKEYRSKEFVKFKKAAQKFAKTPRRPLRPKKQDVVNEYLRRQHEEE
jgi:hypothetical protein